MTQSGSLLEEALISFKKIEITSAQKPGSSISWVITAHRQLPGYPANEQIPVEIGSVFTGKAA